MFQLMLAHLDYWCGLDPYEPQQKYDFSHFEHSIPYMRLVIYIEAKFGFISSIDIGILGKLVMYPALIMRSNLWISLGISRLTTSSSGVEIGGEESPSSPPTHGSGDLPLSCTGRSLDFPCIRFSPVGLSELESVGFECLSRIDVEWSWLSVVVSITCGLACESSWKITTEFVFP